MHAEITMVTTHRFQIDLTRSELDSIERLAQLAGFRTKKELITNAVTLFRWATKETLYGRSICSRNEATGEIRQLEMPALTAIAESVPPEVPREELLKRAGQGTGRPLSEIMADLLRGVAENESVDGNLEQARRRTARGPV